MPAPYSGQSPPRVLHQEDTEQTPTTRHRKRRKYAAVACAECRRRKLKCIPGLVDGRCQRCTSKGHTACDYDVLQRASSKEKNNNHSTETVAALRQDVQHLRDTITDLMSTVKKDSTSRSSSEKTQTQNIPEEVQRPLSLSDDVRRASSNAPDAGTIRGDSPRTDTSGINVHQSRHAPSPMSTRGGPEEPRFIGPTRPAYSLEVGERALSRLGIPVFDMPPPSGAQSPTASPRQATGNVAEQFWESCDAVEFTRLITVFQEEIESVYPCTQTASLVKHAETLIELGRMPDDAVHDMIEARGLPVSVKDIHLARLAMATTIVIEGHGKSEKSTKLVEPVEHNVLSILRPSRELIDLQLLITLSIYYFHSDEDLLAWRTIGLAAREALVLGLHRKASLLDMFSVPEQRDMATRVFWTIYVLDRRWSFGTSLSFALVDRDIDPELPEPGQECAYLQCMVGYGRLCSTLWDALVPYGNWNPDNNVDKRITDLDIKTQEWLESIPLDLRFRHPRLGLAARAQPPQLQRLRALLYLRGNHSRVLIYRYYLLGPERIRSSPQNAWLAVEIAQDSILVLVHLNESSDIYRRQQAAFNYFLLSALAVLFLAVCNDPETFAGPCKRSLHSAIDLLRYFSRHSWGSRRLWSSVRGIVPRLRRLEMRRIDKQHQQQPSDIVQQGTESLPTVVYGASEPPTATASNVQVSAEKTTVTSRGGSGRAMSMTADPSHGQSHSHPIAELRAFDDATAATTMFYNDQAAPSITTPDFSDVGNELLGLYEIFEQGHHYVPQIDMTNFWANRVYAPNSFGDDQGDMSWQFSWLNQ